MLFNETASGWSAQENWDGEEDAGEKENWAYFTYTVSIAWAYRGEKMGVEVDGMGMGYLDDEILLGMGIDDQGQGFARVRAGELVGCLQMCG